MHFASAITTIGLFILIYLTGLAITKRRPRLASMKYHICFFTTSFIIFAVSSLTLEVPFAASVLAGIAVAHLSTLSLFGCQGPDCPYAE